MQKIHMDRRVKRNRKCVVKLHYESTTPAMLFTLKVLRLYKTTNSFYLKQDCGSKQDLKHYTVRNTRICVIYLGGIS